MTRCWSNIQGAARWWRCWLILCACGSVGADLARVHAAERVPSRDAQERARGMARELVATTLDVQLRQLEDNGLEKLPLYGEIEAMRGNIEGLVGNEMQGVVDLLVKAEVAPPDEQARVVQEARRLIRHVTVRLSAERQMLLRRLKVADVAAQVRRLVGQQAAVLKTTDGLPQLPPGRREAATLAAVEQQRTIAALHGVLVSALDDIRTWEGPVGSAAAESLRRLRDGRTDVALHTAEERLAASDFAAAAAAERQVLEILTTLEQRIDRSQAAPSARTQAAVATVRALERQREDLRAQIAKAPPTDAAIEALVEKQAALRNDLAKLDEVAAAAPEVAPLVQKAKDAALASTERLFEGDTKKSVAEEGKVLGSLAEIAARLEQAAPAAAGAKSAEQLAKQVAELRQAAAQLPPADPKRQQAEQAAADAGRAQAATKIAELERAAEAIERAAATERELALAVERAAANPAASKPDPAALKAEQEQVAVVAAKVAEALKNTAADAAAAVEKARPPIAENKPDEAATALAEAAAEIRREAAQTARELVAETEAQREQAAAALARAEADLAAQPAGDPQAATERAAVNMAIREAELSREQAMAQRIAAEAAALEEARAAIQSLGDTMAKQAAAGREQQPQEPPQPGVAQPFDVARQVAAAIERARALEEAQERFAAAQETIGEEAAAIAGQNELASEALREALRAASKLDGGQALANPEAREEAVAVAPPAPLGTGFVPESAAATAEMIAGSEAKAAAEAVLAEAARQAPAAPETPPAGAPAAPRSAEQLAGDVEAMKQTAARAADAESRRRVKESVADLEQAAAATKVAELARAAEAIERVAAAEQELARVEQEAARQAAANPGQPQPDPVAAGERREQVAAAAHEVATQVAEAIKPTAPEAAAAVEQAKPPIAENKTAEAAEALTKAAAEIRREAVAAARDLAKMQEQRLEEARRAQAAEVVANDESSPEAAVSAADGLADLARAKELADRLAADMAAQQQARDRVADRTAELAHALAASPAAKDAPAEGKDRSAARSAAQALRKAQEEFAAAQRAAGEAAAALAGQDELANEPLRAGLERAGEFQPEPPAPFTPPAPLGTGFVPESPEATAELIAGSVAEAAAEELLGPADRSGQEAARAASLAKQSGQPPQAGRESSPPQAAKPGQPAKPSAQPAPGQEPHQAASKSDPKSDHQSNHTSDAQKSDAKSDQAQAARQGEAQADGPLEQTDRVDKDAAVAGTRTGDAEASAKSFEQESWFAKLPPEMRQAIRAKGKRRAPRGYEEKLDRYFRTID